MTAAQRSVVRVATRRSAQATAQAETVAAAIAGTLGIGTELVFVDTTGDQRSDEPLHAMGGQGVFVKEVQRAVLDGRADLAVHSAKDLPSATVDGLTIGAFCERRDPGDALVGRSLAELGAGATVATGSVRRRAQLRELRNDLELTELRGNIASRLDKIPEGGAIVMAIAALEILDLTDRIAQRLDKAVFVPAVGQGCVAVEHRTGDETAAAAVSGVDHAVTRHAVTVERAFLAELGTGCSLPLGAHVDDGVLYTFLASDDGEVADRQMIPVGGNIADDVETARAAAARARSVVEGT